MLRIAKNLGGIALVLSIACTAFSQWTSGGGETPINPNTGQILNPSFAYDPLDGVLYLENSGPNGIVDSLDNLTLLGDDVGFISFLLTAPPDTTVDRLLPLVTDSIAWAAPVVFNGKVQLSGTAINASFLAISEDPMPLVQLAPGFGVDDFRDADGNVSIEVGVNIEFAQPGTTIFTEGDAAASGAFRVLPEPGGFGMLLLAAISMLKLRRR